MSSPFGKYTLLKRLGTGGMAEVFLARRAGDDQAEPVVVKRLLPHLARQVDVVRLFVDEARLTVRLKHPRIARVMDLGSHAGDVFLALEYVPGVDLVALSRGLERHNAAPLPVGAVTRIGIDVADGLYHAHTATDRLGLPLGTCTATCRRRT